MYRNRQPRVITQFQNNPEDDDDDDAYGDEIETYKNENQAQELKDKNTMKNMSLYRQILPKSLLKDKEIQEILEEEEMQPVQKRQKKQINSLDDSLFNLQHINSKGNFKQFYSELFDKIDIQTNCK